MLASYWNKSCTLNRNCCNDGKYARHHLYKNRYVTVHSLVTPKRRAASASHVFDKREAIVDTDFWWDREMEY